MGTKRFLGFDMISRSLFNFVWDGLFLISCWRGKRYFSIASTLFSYSSAFTAAGGVPWEPDVPSNRWGVDEELAIGLDCCWCCRDPWLEEFDILKKYADGAPMGPAVPLAPLGLVGPLGPGDPLGPVNLLLNHEPMNPP